MTLLNVENLSVTFPSRQGPQRVVRDVSFRLGRERLGIVGESGSGKSQTGRAILGLTPTSGTATADRLEFDGIDLRNASHAQWRKLRGARMSMVMQDPKFSLNPVMTIDRPRQIAGDAGSGADPRSRPRHGRLSARTFGRHGPARDDRHDADHRARPADRR
jgi:peptide/nickel transport system ATP-binding protein